MTRKSTRKSTGKSTRKSTRILALAGSFAFSLGLAARAEAHKASDSYLTLEAPVAAQGDAALGDQSQATVVLPARWDIALRDLDDALVLDADGNGSLTEGELEAREGEITRYALEHLMIAAEHRPCDIKVAPLTTTTHSDGAYAVLAMQVTCPRRAAAHDLTLRYSLLFDLDRLHCGLLHLGASTWVLSPAAPTADLTATAQIAPFDTPEASRRTPRRLVELAVEVVHFGREGAGHIASGFDHLLFLLALLLPAVLRRGPGSSGFPHGHWHGEPSLKAVLSDVARIITAFTLAHSLTLALAASGWVRMPSRLVEPAIAASVVLAALNNLVPLFGKDRWVVAFALGLLHGFGFSAALTDLGLSGIGFAVALFGFNAGVELGQLALVAVILPLSFAARNTSFYRKGVLGAGSMAIALCATVWFVERAFDLSLPFSNRS